MYHNLNMKKIIFFMMPFLCFFAFSASSSKAPEWVLNCENVYPPENFFSADFPVPSAEKDRKSVV